MYVLWNLTWTNSLQSPCIVQDSLGRYLNENDIQDMKRLHDTQIEYEHAVKSHPNHKTPDARPIPQSFDIPPTLITEMLVRQIVANPTHSD